MTRFYGIVGRHASDAPDAESWLCAFELIDLAQYEANGPDSVFVIFKPMAPVQALGLDPAQAYYFGTFGNAKTPLEKILPFSTGEHHGFSEFLGADAIGRIAGDGSFFLSVDEAKRYANRYPFAFPNLIDLTYDNEAPA